MNIKITKFSSLIFSALFTAILCIVSQIIIPTPFGIPFTLQTFIIAFCGFLLGTSRSVSAIAVYITLGAVGLPVFSQFRGGAQFLFSATGGYIIGFLILAAACGMAERLLKDIFKITVSIIGLLICHLIGVSVFYLVSNTSFLQSAVISSLPFIIKDIISVIAAFYLAKKLKKQRL